MAHPTLDLAVRDRQGNTPFAAALAVKDSETGQAIVQRDPKAAEQVRFCNMYVCTSVRGSRIL